MTPCYLFPKTPIAWNSTNRARSFAPQTMEHSDAVEFLRVEANPRYTPAPPITYCNVAAHDFATLRGHYIPRVWWTAQAIRERATVAEYGVNCREMNANALHDWFDEFGHAFNWVKIHGWKNAMPVVNAGGMAIIVARRKDRSRAGHISVIQPSAEDASSPLQWQAGAVNRESFRSQWYTSKLYDSYAIWCSR